MSWKRFSFTDPAFGFNCSQAAPPVLAVQFSNCPPMLSISIGRIAFIPFSGLPKSRAEVWITSFAGCAVGGFDALLCEMKRGITSMPITLAKTTMHTIAMINHLFLEEDFLLWRVLDRKSVV